MKNKLLHILTTIAFLYLPFFNFAQAPNLGSVAKFVLFSSNGAVTNTGITHLTGNVGTNNGSNTGFGNVDGVMHSSDSVSALCAADLLNAYNQLDSAIPDFFPAPLLGNGDTLIAGTYSISGTASLSNILTLNAQGNANAVFIIKIQGAFSTFANSKVKLINGAKACNVFWKIEGLVDMATGTVMRGTVIAHNAGINMNTGDTLEGRALSTTGAISVNGIYAYTQTGCGSPYLTGPAVPDLLSTACYTIFSASGPVTNSGTSTITGDIGTNVGLTTGFDSLLVTGKIHPIADISTAACAADLLTIYTYLNNLPSDIELLYPAQFGGNLVLTPHTYQMNAATTFTDSIYLNAAGNANAVFVIKINGALATSTYSKVLLINGAQAKNVFWKVDGAVHINNYSDFKGIIICNNGAINLDTGSTLEGRAFTTTGSLKTSSITAVMTPGCNIVTPGQITVQPTNYIGCQGSSATYTVVAVGTGISYQWRKGTTPLLNTSSISGVQTPTLIINNVTLADESADYNVLITAGLLPQDSSVHVSLTVHVAPSIVTQPMDTIVCAGNSGSFKTIASGTNLSYQWRRGLVNVTNGGNISGATNANLIIDNVTATDTGSNYNVVVTGICLPAIISSNVSLTLCNTTGINDVNTLDRNEVANIYPNPFTKTMFVNLNTLSGSPKQIVVMNILGEQVLTVSLTEQSTSIETTFGAGMYFYQIISGGNIVQSGKMIAQ